MNRLLLCLLLLGMVGGGLVGCGAARPMPVVDAAQPGWRMQHFPALWRPPGREAPEIAGEAWLARHEDGRALIHFAKVPFPSVIAWRAPGEWQIEYQPQRRRARGSGTPPQTYVLLWVPEALEGRPVPPALVIETLPGQAHAVRLRHRQSGETWTLFKQP